MKKNRIHNLAISITSMILIVMSISLMYSIYKLSIIKLMYAVVLDSLIILIDLLLINYIENKNKNIKKRRILTFISFIFIIIYFNLIIYLISTFNFIEKVTSNNNDLIKYSVIVKKDKDIKIKDLDNKKLGFITLPNLTESKVALTKNLSYSFITSDYDSYSSLIKAYDKKYVDALVVPSISLKDSDNFKDYKEVYNYDLKLTSFDNINERKDSYVILISVSSDAKYDEDSIANILLIVNKETKKTMTVFLPNNLYINLYNSPGKRELLKYTLNYGTFIYTNSVAQLLDVNIDYYLKVDKDFVVKTVNNLNGIELNNKVLDGENFYKYINDDVKKNKSAYNSFKFKLFSKNLLFKYDDILDYSKNHVKSNLNYQELIDIFKNDFFFIKNNEDVILIGNANNRKSYTYNKEERVIDIDNKEINEIKEKIKSIRK